MKPLLKFALAILLVAQTGIGCVLVQRDDSAESFQTLALLYLLVENENNKNSTQNPTITIVNASGNPESYLMYTTACTGSPTYTFDNPYSNGSTTETLTISAGAYYVSIFVGCTSSAVTAVNPRR